MGKRRSWEEQAKRALAKRAVELVRMRECVPCEVEDSVNGYRGKMVEVVFDPMRQREVNAAYRAAGFEVREGMYVVAVMEAGELLLWGGSNSIYRLARGEKIASLGENLAFNDLKDLTGRFGFKIKPGEIDEMVAAGEAGRAVYLGVE